MRTVNVYICNGLVRVIEATPLRESRLFCKHGISIRSVPVRDRFPCVDPNIKGTHLNRPFVSNYRLIQHCRSIRVSVPLTILRRHSDSQPFQHSLNSFALSDNFTSDSKNIN